MKTAELEGARPDAVVCVLDNPATMCREAWRNGQMIAHISATLLLTKGFNGFKTMPFMLNCGRDFKPGRIYGDSSALDSIAKFGGQVPEIAQ
jgi:hypothetical protein